VTAEDRMLFNVNTNGLGFHEVFLIQNNCDCSAQDGENLYIDYLFFIKFYPFCIF